MALFGAKHSPQSGQNAKSHRPKSRVKISTRNFQFRPVSIHGSSPYSKPRKPILTAPRSLIFSSKSFLAATQSWSQVWKLTAMRNIFLKMENFIENRNWIQILNADLDSATSNYYENFQNHCDLEKICVLKVPGFCTFSKILPRAEISRKMLEIQKMQIRKNFERIVYSENAESASHPSVT